MQRVPILCSRLTGWVAVRDLRGVDEEALAGTDTDAAVALVDRLLVAAPETISLGALDLAAPDRDRVLAAIYGRAFGTEIEAVRGCERCGERFELTVPVEHMAAELTARTVRADAGWYEHAGARFRLPTADDELAVAALPADEQEDALLARCGGDPAAMDEVAPLIDVELAATCPSCGHPHELPFSIQTYLLEAIAQETPLRTREIHALARSYGWTLGEILELPRTRRRAFAAPRRGRAVTRSYLRRLVDRTHVRPMSVSRPVAPVEDIVETLVPPPPAPVAPASVAPPAMPMPAPTPAQPALAPPAPISSPPLAVIPPAIATAPITRAPPIVAPSVSTTPTTIHVPGPATTIVEATPPPPSAPLPPRVIAPGSVIAVRGGPRAVRPPQPTKAQTPTASSPSTPAVIAPIPAIAPPPVRAPAPAVAIAPPRAAPPILPVAPTAVAPRAEAPQPVIGHIHVEVIPTAAIPAPVAAPRATPSRSAPSPSPAATSRARFGLGQG